MSLRLNTRRAALAALTALLCACAGPTIVAVGDGETIVNNGLAVSGSRVWNRFDSEPGGLHPVWTQHGIALDTVRFYPGLKNGELLVPTPAQAKGARPLAWSAGMQTQDIVGLFESWVSRDGSSFSLDKLDPASFLGQSGVRLEYTSVRKSDELTIRGVVWFAVRDGRLYAISYAAPRLGFFDRELAEVEAIARSARAV